MLDLMMYLPAGIYIYYRLCYCVEENGSGSLYYIVLRAILAEIRINTDKDKGSLLGHTRKVATENI